MHAAQALTYQDEDGARKDDIASLKVDQADFKVFYDKVKELKDYYRNKPIEVTEVSYKSSLCMFTHTSVLRQTVQDPTARQYPHECMQEVTLGLETGF